MKRYLAMILLASAAFLGCSSSPEQVKDSDHTIAMKSATKSSWESFVSIPNSAILTLSDLGKELRKDEEDKKLAPVSRTINCDNFPAGLISFKFADAEKAKDIKAAYFLYNDNYILKTTPETPAFTVDGDTINIKFNFDPSFDTMARFYLTFFRTGLMSREYELINDNIDKEMAEKIVKILNDLGDQDKTYSATLEEAYNFYFENPSHFYKVTKGWSIGADPEFRLTDGSGWVGGAGYSGTCSVEVSKKIVH